MTASIRKVPAKTPVRTPRRVRRDQPVAGDLTVRHIEVFDPDLFADRRIDVIGVGATGSRIVLELAKLGIRNIHIWDFDVVEAHNIGNQIFGLEDVGQLKVEALARIVHRDTGITIYPHNKKVVGPEDWGKVIFMLPDTMACRKELFDNGKIKYNLGIDLLLETRMGADSGRVYAINPSNADHIGQYEKTLYDDTKTEASACGAQVTVGATAAFVASTAVWQFIKWFENSLGKGHPFENELLFALRPVVTLLSRTF